MAGNFLQVLWILFSPINFPVIDSLNKDPGWRHPDISLSSIGLPFELAATMTPLALCLNVNLAGLTIGKELMSKVFFKLSPIPFY
jgi:hypothetical protein